MTSAMTSTVTSAKLSRFYLRVAAAATALCIGGAAFALITVTPSPIPSPATGVAYNVALSGAGGDAPYTFIATNGHLPAGIALSPDGALAGTATSAAGFNYTVVAADAEGRETDVTAAAGATVAASLASSIASSVFGQSVAFTATVTGASPAGSVQFCADGNPADATFCASGTLLCGAGATLNGVTAGSSVATCPVTSLDVGSHNIVAHYAGDANNSPPPVTNTKALLVNKAATLLTLTAPSGVPIGQTVGVSVGVAAVAPGAGTPSGSVTISDGSAACVVVLPLTACTLTPTSPGSKTLTATYGGDAHFTASNASAALTIGLLAANVVVTSSANPSTIGQSVTLTATVTQQAAPAAGNAKALIAATPTGTVTFTSGAAPLGTAVLNASGQASVTTPALLAGAHPITAAYSGDATTAAATGTLVQQVDGGPVPTPAGSGEGLVLLTLALTVLAAFGTRRRLSGRRR